MINNKIKTIKTGGFTLVEVIIGVALMLIVFSGIFGAYRLSLKVVGLSKDKVVATAIANSQIEKIRNLPYASVGTLGAVLPQVSGTLDRMATETLDGENFTITTSVEYVIDPADGTGASDPCNWDYKSVSVIVYWSGPYAGSVAISTIVAPKSVVEETQTCLAQPGGVLTVTVFDSHGLIVATPLISIYNIGGSIFYGSATPTTGIYSFPLAAGTYRVVVTKDGYTTARSYGTNEIATPNTLNPTLLYNANFPII
jgi:type II secretory pathway pseudopilin PulG